MKSLNSHKNRTYKKISSAFLILSFAANILLNSAPAFANAVQPQASSEDIWSWKLPQELGRLEDSNKFDASKTSLVVIQDAHSIADAQFSIKRILHELSGRGIRTVALEGTEGDLDTALLRSFPDQEILNDVINEYVSKGELAGSAAAALLNSEELRFTGVENMDLYKEAVDLYLNAEEEEAEFKKRITALQNQHASLQKTFNSPGSLELLTLLTRFEKEPEKMPEIFSALENIKKPSPEIYPHLSAVMREVKTKTPENTAALEKELDFLTAQFLKQTKDKIKAQVLNKHVQDFQTGITGLPALASFLLNAANEEGIELEPSLSLQEQARLFQTLESIRGAEFFKEFENYGTELKKKVFKTEEENLLDNLSKQIQIFIKYTSLELSREEWSGFNAEKGKIAAKDLERVDARVREFAVRAQNEMGDFLKRFSNHSKFYRNAELREQAMLEKTLKALDQNRQNTGAIILGGFHTQGFLELLSKRKISYILVTPSIHQLPSENIYKAGMRGQVSWSGYFNPNNGKIDLYDAFSRAASEKMLKVFSGKRKDSVTELLKKWRDGILSRLASENKIADAQAYTAYVDRLRFQNSSEPEKEKIIQEWQKIVKEFLNKIQTLKVEGKLTAENLAGWKPAVNAQGWLAIPLVPGVTAKSSWVRNAFSGAAAEGARSELRLSKELDYAALKGLDHVKDSTVISLQMEMGYSAGFLKAIEAKYGKKVADQVSQATLTGGLGALMHDLFPSWKANGLDVIGIHPIWEEIKKKPYPEGPLNLGQYQRQIMEEEMAKRHEAVIEYTLDLTWDEDFKRYAQENEKTKNAFGRKVHVRVLKEYTSQYGAPNYHLDAYYLKDEGKPDTEENRHRIFDTVYSDDHPSWRDYHLAVYARASEQLIKILKKQGVVKEKTVEIHNEVFVSMPKMEKDDNRTLVHINHSAYLPTIYSPNVKSYGLLGFPAWMRQYIVKDGNSISIVDFAALNYDLLTGVAIDEHYWVLRRNIFRNAGSRLDYYNDGEIRSTNGVLTEHWQSLALQNLIEYYRIQLGLPEKVDSAIFYKTLEANSALKQKFVERQEFIKAAEAANFLKWMADIQKQPMWLEDALRESGKTRVDFDNFFNEIEKVSQSNDSESWDRIKKEHASLRDILLSHPMVSNARRQVPYKGPEKWLEVLESLRDPNRLSDFKKTKIRVIIGGRTFSDQADGEFQAMKRIVRELGLESHFAFIEDYNVFDAAIMFRAMAGVVMLSDEFLEASATSMMKGVVNGAALIGVWGGAMPEIFKIIDETGQVVDIFKKKTSHDLVVKNLRSKKWKLVNGYMVRYSSEKSHQAGGGRRPDAQALASSLSWLHDQYADPAKRQELLWQSVSGTPKVDMREGQARAHMQLIERLLKAKEHAQRDVFEPLKFNTADFQKVLRDRGNAFVWRRQFGDDTIFKPGKVSPAGIFGLVNMFREISTYGSGDERGKAAMDAIRHHALQGDFFKFILDELQDAPPALKPFVDEIKKLAGEASLIPNELRKIHEDPEMEDEYLVGLTRLTNLNVQAMELIEKLGLWIAKQSFETYLDNNDAAVTEQLHKVIFSNHFIKKYLSRYLDQRADTYPLYTRDSLIRAYGIIHKGQPYIFGVNLGADPTINRNKPQNKAYTDIPLTPSAKKFFDQFVPDINRGVSDINAVYQAVNAKNNEGYAYYNLTNPATLIPLGVPSPEDVQLIKLVKRNALVAQLLAAPSTPAFNTATLQSFLTNLQEKAQAKPGELSQEKIDALMLEIAEIQPEIARAQFGEYLPQIMALVAVLSPHYLDKIKDWDIMVYASLKKTIAQNAKLFEAGKVTFHKTSREQTVVISRTIGGKENTLSHQNIIFALEFSKERAGPHDGKVASRILELAPISLEPTHEYDVWNALTGISYQAVRTGTELMDGWPIRIPVVNYYENGQKVRHDWGFDIYQIQSVTPRFDRVSSETVIPMPKFFLGLNMLDLAATYDNYSATVSSQAGLPKLNNLIPTLERSGVGAVYLYGGLFSMGKISQKLHSVETNGIHWIGDTAEGTLPRVLVSVKDYNTKHVGNLRDNQGNSFSPLDLEGIDYRQAPSALSGPDDTDSLLRESVSKLKGKGIQSIFDFIFWRAPESVNEINYKQYFYRELNTDEREDWEAAHTDDERLKVMKNLTRAGGHFAVRINEGGRDRIILVKHMFNEPGRDQAIRNPFNPDVIARSKREIEIAIDRGAFGVRIDLAHKLLNSELKTMFEVWGKEGFVTDSSGAYPSDYEPLQDLIKHAKQYAANKNREFYVIAEAYMEYHHDPLKKLGVDAVYYENLYKDYKALTGGSAEISSRNLGEALATAFQNKDLFVFPSNFDVAPLKDLHGSREAFLLAMVILARSGVPVMIDARELMDQHGQLVPIPGDAHPFPTPDEIRKRRDFEHFRWQFEQSPYVGMIREFVRLINGRKLKSVKILDNENRDQFITLDLEFEKPQGDTKINDHLIVILNMKPSDDRIIWSQGPHAEGSRELTDLQTGERFSERDGRIQGIVFPSNIQYRMLEAVPSEVQGGTEALPVSRSEVRFAQNAASEALKDLAVERQITRLSAQKVSAAANQEGFASEVLRQSVDQHLLEVFAAFEAAENSTGKIKDFYEKHPAYQEDLEKFWMNKIQEMRNSAHDYLLSRPDAELNFTFAIPMPESPKIRGWFLRYVNMIAQLRADYPSRVKGAIRILATNSQIQDPSLREFWREAGTTGIVKPLETGTPSTGYKVESYLKQYGNALIYGAENLDVQPKNKIRLVKSSDDVNFETVFTVAGLLTFELAGVQGVLADETLRHIPDLLPGIRYSSERLEIQHSAMELVYQQFRAGQLFTVSA